MTADALSRAGDQSKVTSDRIRVPLFVRLQTTMGADTADLQALAALPFTLRQYGENQTVLRDGETPSECCLIADGFRVRSKTIADGRRQILSIHIPGDLPNLQNPHSARPWA